jgi:HlyD family secretion protein
MNEDLKKPETQKHIRVKKTRSWGFYALWFVAILCVFFAIKTALRTDETVHPRNLSYQSELPPLSPFTHKIAGEGIIEASTENILIGTQLSGTIAQIYAQPGETVKTGAPLFSLDKRTYESQRLQQACALEVAEAALALLKAQPRPETIPPLEAKVTEATASVSSAQAQWDSVVNLRGTGAVADEDFRSRQAQLEFSKAQLEEAKSNLALHLAGAWSYEIAQAQAQVDLAKANLRVTETNLALCTVRAPTNGTLLRIYAHVGEFAPGGQLTTPLMVFGNTAPLNLRVDIDEKDISRFLSEKSAYGIPRGNSTQKFPLKFVRTEKLVVPKKSLTGDPNERVDTRVMQIIYTLPLDATGLYVGQQMDVYIEAEELDTSKLMHKA